MGKYYLEIKTNGDYSFSIHEKKLDNDYNRNFAEAELLRKEKTIDGTIDFGELATHEGDEDYFKLFIPGYYHGKYIIHLTGDTEVVGQLYNEQKESISEEFSQSLTKKLHPGLYFVKIRGKKANSQGDYQVSYSSEEQFEEASELPFNKMVQDDLGLIRGARYYQFHVEKPEQLDFYLANSKLTTMEVYDQTHQRLVGETWETTNHKMSGNFLPGTYYVKITSQFASNYKLMIHEQQRKENLIEVVELGPTRQIHLNGVLSPELTQLYNKRFIARSLMLPSPSSLLNFMKGLVTEWSINTGGVPFLDTLFGTDRTGYLQEWQGKSKSYALGMYAGDAISLVQGAVSFVGAGMFIAGSNLFGIAAAPFSGGASLTICPIATTVSVAVAAEAGTMVISAAQNINEGHGWDPALEEKASGAGNLKIPKATELTMTETVRNHATDIIKKGVNAGELSRPYIGSNEANLLIQEIMDSGIPVKAASLPKLSLPN
ncbi:hypothetical protein ACSFB8_05655 [Enterococcus faecalis]